MLLQRPPSRPRTRSKSWLGLPLIISIFFHVLLLASVEGLHLLEILPPAPDAAEARTVEVSTAVADPSRPEPIGPPEPTESISLLPETPELTPELFPRTRPRGPQRPEPDRKPITRYPEEELPVIALPELSDRTRLLLRDGELDIVDPGRGIEVYEPSERRIEETPPVQIKAEPRLQADTDVLAGAIRPTQPRRAATSPEPPTATTPERTHRLDPPRIEPATDLSPGIEQLFARDFDPVEAEPLPLNVQIDVYAEPENDDRFFRLTITESDDLQLPVLQKNILFVVDISASVRQHMLRAIQSAVRDKAAEGFNEGDRFNMVRFSELTFKTFAGFVPATAENIRRAARVIRKESGQVRTDVYQALVSVVGDLPSEGEDAHQPTHIYLISDGDATTGVRDLRRIVTDLGDVTRPNHSISALIPGTEHGDRYLLDLLTYRNRGMFAHARNTDDVGRKLGELLRRFRYPILVDIRARFGSFREARVYPEQLPDLYRGEPIVVHGRCRPGDTIALGIIGRTAEGPRQFVYSHRLPEVLTNDPTIARGWARGKIHHIAALIAIGDDQPEYREEIDRLSERYDLESPFK